LLNNSAHKGGINKEACERMVKNLIASNPNINNPVQNNSSQGKKLNKSVPIPEQIHMNWQKDIK
jgi:hypothetical protein